MPYQVLNNLHFNLGTVPASASAGLAAATGAALAAAVLRSKTASAGLAAATGTARQPSVSVPATLIYGFAVNQLVYYDNAGQEAALAGMASIGTTNIRVDANWSVIQAGGSGSWNWSALDQLVGNIHDAGMDTLLIILGTPAWAIASGSGQFATPQAGPFATFAAAVATRYASQASAVEIWNEQNNTVFWSPTPNAAAYTTILKAAYPAVKAAVPSMTVVTGGLCPATYVAVDYLSAMYAAGAHGYFDAVGWHPYTFPADPNTATWAAMYSGNPNARGLMTANGDADKKIWMTEFGVPVGWSGITQQIQADQIDMAITQAKSYSWAGSIHIYNWQDSGSEPFGVLDINGNHKLSYDVVAADFT